MRLNEIRSLLKEEPVPTQTAEEIWDANGGNEAAQYISTTVYFVRPVKGSEDKFEVLYDERGKRKTYGTFDQEDLEASFTPVRANQKPDVEGFTQYRSSDVFAATKYGGEPTRVTLDAAPDGEAEGRTVKLNTGDWILRQDDGKDFIYTVERADYFDNGYIKKT